MTLPLAPVPPPLDLAGEDLPPLLQSRLAGLEPVLASVYEVRPLALAAFALLAGVLVLSGLAVGLRGRPRRRGIWCLALLAVLAFPAASVLMFVPAPRPGSPAVVLAALVGVWAALWAAVAAFAFLGGPRRALATLLLGTSALLLAGQWLDIPVSAVGVLGYSPLDGARFYGMGNEGAALLFGSALTGVGLCAEGAGEGSRRRMLARWAFPLIGAVVVLTAAAPSLGANVTVAAWGTLGFAAAALTAWGRRVGWRELVGGIAAVALVLVALAALDLARGDGGTHLARALRALGDGGAAALVPLVARKVAMNLRILTATPGSLVVMGGMAWLAWALWRPRERLAALLRVRPEFRASLIGALVGSAVALVTEDSGIVIPALVLLFAGGTLAYLATALPAPSPAAEPDAGAGADVPASAGAEGVGE